MTEISHVRLGVPDQAALQRILREGGAQAFPQWLYAEPTDEPSLLWWGVRGAPEEIAAGTAAEGSRLYPRPIDDWTDPPRGLVLATVEMERAGSELEDALDLKWLDDVDDPVLDARCRRATLGRSVLVLAEPAGEGYLAAFLARHGEGPVAVALDGRGAGGRVAERNPVTLGRATYVRLGARDAPTFIFVHAP